MCVSHSKVKQENKNRFINLKSIFSVGLDILITNPVKGIKWTKTTLRLFNLHLIKICILVLMFA